MAEEYVVTAEPITGNNLAAIQDQIGVFPDGIPEILSALFSISDTSSRYLVVSARESILVHGDVTEDPVRAATIRAIFRNNRTGVGFFPAYMQELYTPKGKIDSYFKFAERGNYIGGLPNIRITGGNADLAAIKLALDTEKGGDNNTLTISSVTPSPEQYFVNDMQCI